MLVNVYFFPVSNPFLENTLAGLFPALNFQWYFDVPPLFLISTQKDNLCCYLVSRASQVAGGEELPGNSGDAGLIPGSGRSAGEGNGNPLQYSCLGKFHRQRNLGGHSPWGCKRVRRDLATKQQQITCLPACLSCANQLIQGLYPQLPSYLPLTHQSNISPTLNHVRSKCQLTGD